MWQARHCETILGTEPPVEMELADLLSVEAALEDDEAGEVAGSSLVTEGFFVDGKLEDKGAIDDGGAGDDEDVEEEE